MAQQKLQRAQVGVAGEQVDGVAVPQEMRIDAPRQPTPGGVAFEARPESPFVQPSPATREKQGRLITRESSTTGREVYPQDYSRLGTEGDKPLV